MAQELFVRDGPGVLSADAVEGGAFAVRCVDFLTLSREFDFADGEHMPRAFVEQPDDFGVQLVNRLAIVQKAHARRKNVGNRLQESIRSCGLIH